MYNVLNKQRDPVAVDTENHYSNLFEMQSRNVDKMAK